MLLHLLTLDKKIEVNRIQEIKKANHIKLNMFRMNSYFGDKGIFIVDNIFFLSLKLCLQTPIPYQDLAR